MLRTWLSRKHLLFFIISCLSLFIGVRDIRANSFVNDTSVTEVRLVIREAKNNNNNRNKDKDKDKRELTATSVVFSPNDGLLENLLKIPQTLLRHLTSLFS